MGIEAKFVKRDWVAFNLIKLVHENYSRPQNPNISTASNDNELAKSIKENGWNPDFKMAVEIMKDGKFALHGGFRRYGVISGLVNEGKLPDDFQVYCEIYSELTDNERIDLNLSHNPARVGEANPATVQEFTRCYDNFKKQFKTNKGVEKPEDSEISLMRCMRLSSRGKAQGFYPLLSLAKLLPDLCIIERVKDSVSGSPKADAIPLGKAQDKKGDTKKILDEVIQARANISDVAKKNEKLSALGQSFNALWIEVEGEVAPRRMSSEILTRDIIGNDNELVALVGRADVANDTTAIGFSKEFNAATKMLLAIKDRADVLEQVSHYIEQFLTVKA